MAWKRQAITLNNEDPVQLHVRRWASVSQMYDFISFPVGMDN